MIVANTNEPEYASEVTMRRLRYYIAIALIDSDEKIRIETESYFYNEQEAENKIQYLIQYLPIPGHHTIAHGVAEINQAVRYAVDKDDFYERHNNSDTDREYLDQKGQDC